MIAEDINYMADVKRAAIENHIRSIYQKNENLVKSEKEKTTFRGVMIIVIGNGHGDTSSNPGRDRLHFTSH